MTLVLKNIIIWYILVMIIQLVGTVRTKSYKTNYYTITHLHLIKWAGDYKTIFLN